MKCTLTSNSSIVSEETDLLLEVAEEETALMQQQREERGHCLGHTCNHGAGGVFSCRSRGVD